MKARIAYLLITTFISSVLFAQSDMLVQGSTPDLYLVHNVSPKENWYSLARLYNGTPKELATYNNLTIDKPLTIGQVVKIPLRIANFSQNNRKASDEVLVPVYHVIQDKEWLYRISVNYNKVPVDQLEKWNGITNDEAKAGMKLIVGHLKVKKDQSPLANAAAAPGSVVSQPVATVEEKKSEPVAREQQPAQTKPVEERKPVTDVRPVNNSATGGGYFRVLYEDSGKQSSGVAGVFKSTSGWQDAKYYALMNNVAVGTIIRISNPANNKMIFAKVLGDLPDMKESIGLTLRISDAAASELGSPDAKFSVAVRY
jgi:LysM repeat protein